MFIVFLFYYCVLNAFCAANMEVQKLMVDMEKAFDIVKAKYVPKLNTDKGEDQRMLRLKVNNGACTCSPGSHKNYERELPNPQNGTQKGLEGNESHIEAPTNQIEKNITASNETSNSVNGIQTSGTNEDEDDNFFAQFLIESFKLIIHMDKVYVKRFTMAAEYEITKLSQNQKLVDFGEPFSSGIVALARLINGLQADMLQAKAITGLQKIENRNKSLEPQDNALIELVNNIYTEPDEENIVKALSDVRDYPNVTKTVYEVVHDLIEDVVIKPFRRIEGTVERAMLKSYLNNLVLRYYMPESQPMRKYYLINNNRLDKTVSEYSIIKKSKLFSAAERYKSLYEKNNKTKPSIIKEEFIKDSIISQRGGKKTNTGIKKQQDLFTVIANNNKITNRNIQKRFNIVKFKKNPIEETFNNLTKKVSQRTKQMQSREEKPQILKKIINLSSHSDEELLLKTNLNNAAMKKSRGQYGQKYFRTKMNVFSSISDDEEMIMKNKIYNVFETNMAKLEN